MDGVPLPAEAVESFGGVSSLKARFELFASGQAPKTTKPQTLSRRGSAVEIPRVVHEEDNPQRGSLIDRMNDFGKGSVPSELLSGAVGPVSFRPTIPRRRSSSEGYVKGGKEAEPPDNYRNQSFPASSSSSKIASTLAAPGLPSNAPPVPPFANRPPVVRSDSFPSATTLATNRKIPPPPPPSRKISTSSVPLLRTMSATAPSRPSRPSSLSANSFATDRSVPLPVILKSAPSPMEIQFTSQNIPAASPELIRTEKFAPTKKEGSTARLPPVPPRPSIQLRPVSSPSPASAPQTLAPIVAPALPHHPFLSASPQNTLLPPPPPRRAPSPAVSPSRSRAGSYLASPRASISSASALPPPILPRPSSSASLPPPNTSIDQTPYLPLPPPSRAIAAHERLAPQRPAIEKAGGSGEDSDEVEEEEDAFSRSQEYPDSTFANRRPPALRNRKPLRALGQVYSLAVRGSRVVTGQHHVYVWHPSEHSDSSRAIPLPGGDHKVHAIDFRAGSLGDSTGDGRYAWGGTKDGHVFEVDTEECKVSNVRMAAHSHSIVAIYRLGRSMLTLDDSGKLLIWGSFDSSEAPNLTGTPKAQRLADKQNFVGLVGNELWTSSGPTPKSGTSSVLSRGPQIRVYDPTGRGPFPVTPRPITIPSGPELGAVTSSAIVPSQEQHVFLGHDNGYVSVWSRESYTCVATQRVSPFGITSLVGVSKYLWAGFRNGFINIYDVDSDPWTVLKAWKAHKEAVTKIVVDPASLWTDDTLQVASCGTDQEIQFWDGLLRTDWLDSEMQLRQSDYCTFRSIKTLSISWNIDASKPSDLVGSVANIEFLHQCLTSVDGPDIISFGFQEMIDLENKGLTAKTMLFGNKNKGDQKFADGVSSSYRAWHDKLVQAVRIAMPPDSPYTVVHVGDLVGLFSCIFVKNTEAKKLRDVALITVKTGMKGRYGNKGAILSRFVIDDTSICFINVHLAAGQAHRRQRDNDLVNILEDKSAFSELSTSSFGAYLSGGIGHHVFDHEICFLSGDLNYRIDARRDAVVSAVGRGEYEHLLGMDQLLKGLANNQSFRLRSFKEAKITFAPTYKYDPGTNEYDTSPKRRIPAWCDRVLYRADNVGKVTPLHYQRYECNISDHKPISAAFKIEIKSILPDKRAMVWKEIEQAWNGVEMELLTRAKKYYGTT